MEIVDRLRVGVVFNSMPGAETVLLAGDPVPSFLAGISGLLPDRAGIVVTIDRSHFVEVPFTSEDGYILPSLKSEMIDPGFRDMPTGRKVGRYFVRFSVEGERPCHVGDRMFPEYCIDASTLSYGAGDTVRDAVLAASVRYELRSRRI